MGGGDKTEKTTIMVLKVDLQCPSCYKKAKKVLCKIPQVRDQVYDEKGNTIAITVVCCSPEKVRDKLCYKGGKAIKSIEIKEPAKPKAPEKPKEPENQKQPEKPKGSDKPKVVTFETPKEKPKEPEKPKGPEKPTVIDKPKPKEPEKPKEATKAAMVATPWAAEPVVMMPLPVVQGYPQGCGCGQCYHTGGPCCQYYGTPVPPGPYYGSYPYGYGPGPGYGKSSYVSGDYFNDENAQGCTIM